MQPRLIDIEPLGTDVILPGIVLGYELGESAILESICPPDAARHIHISQQAGGLAMSYPSVIGLVLRLASNLAELQEGQKVIRGLKAMAEDPKLSLLKREYPEFARLVLTHGQPYSKEQLDSLSDALRLHMRLPPIESGIEAFVRFEACDLRSYFDGWNVLAASAPAGLASIYDPAIADRIHIDDSNVRQLSLQDDTCFDSASFASLVALGGVLGSKNCPRAFLLWENSD